MEDIKVRQYTMVANGDPYHPESFSVVFQEFDDYDVAQYVKVAAPFYENIHFPEDGWFAPIEYIQSGDPKNIKSWKLFCDSEERLSEVIFGEDRLNEESFVDFYEGNNKTPYKSIYGQNPLNEKSFEIFKNTDPLTGKLLNNGVIYGQNPKHKNSKVENYDEKGRCVSIIYGDDLLNKHSIEMIYGDDGRMIEMKVGGEVKRFN